MSICSHALQLFKGMKCNIKILLTIFSVTIYWSDFLGFPEKQDANPLVERGTYVGRFSCFDITFSGPGSSLFHRQAKMPRVQATLYVVSRISKLPKIIKEITGCSQEDVYMLDDYYFQQTYHEHIWFLIQINFSQCKEVLPFLTV